MFDFYRYLLNGIHYRLKRNDRAFIARKYCRTSNLTTIMSSY